MLSAIRFRYSAAIRFYDESRDLCLAALLRYVPKLQKLGIVAVDCCTLCEAFALLSLIFDIFRFRTSARRIIKDSMTSEN